jgi:hypothetical protein
VSHWRLPGSNNSKKFPVFECAGPFLFVKRCGQY